MLVGRPLRQVHQQLLRPHERHVLPSKRFFLTAKPSFWPDPGLCFNRQQEQLRLVLQVIVINYYASHTE